MGACNGWELYFCDGSTQLFRCFPFECAFDLLLHWSERFRLFPLLVDVTSSFSWWDGCNRFDVGTAILLVRLPLVGELDDGVDTWFFFLARRLRAFRSCVAVGAVMILRAECCCLFLLFLQFRLLLDQIYDKCYSNNNEDFTGGWWITSLLSLSLPVRWHRIRDSTYQPHPQLATIENLSTTLS